MKYFDFLCDKDGIRLSRYVLGRIAGLGYASFLKVLDARDVKINTKRVNKDVLLNKDDRVEVYVKESALEFSNTEIVYQSDDIVVFNKPKRISTEAFADLVKSSVNPNLLACHRLDTNTTGLIIFAKTKKSFDIIKTGINNRKVSKRYIAKVLGEYVGEKTYEAYLIKDRERGVVSISNTQISGSVKIITGVKGIKTFDGKSLVEVALITGKTHQIRAHLAHLGFPIIGDPKYGDFSYNKLEEATSQQLCAYKLFFCFDKDSQLNYLNDITLQIKCDFST